MNRDYRIEPMASTTGRQKECKLIVRHEQGQEFLYLRAFETAGYAIDHFLNQQCTVCIGESFYPRSILQIAIDYLLEHGAIAVDLSRLRSDI